MTASHQTPAAASRPSPAVATAGPPPSPRLAHLRGEGGSQASWRDVPDCPLAPALQAMADAMAEDKGAESVEAHLRAYLRDFGLELNYHTRDSRRSPAGFLDWTVLGPSGFLVAELKRQKGKPTQAQERWLDGWERLGAMVRVYRPCCVLSGRMARELAALAGMRTA